MGSDNHGVGEDEDKHGANEHLLARQVHDLLPLLSGCEGLELFLDGCTLAHPLTPLCIFSETEGSPH